MAGLSVSNSLKSCHICKQGSLSKCVTILPGWWRKKPATPRLPSLLMHGLFAMQISPSPQALRKHGGRCHSFSNRRHLVKWQCPQIKLFQPFHLMGALASFPPLQERTVGAPLCSAACGPPCCCHGLKGQGTFPQGTTQLHSKESSYLQKHWIRPEKRPWSCCQDTGTPVLPLWHCCSARLGGSEPRTALGWCPSLGFCAFGVLPALARSAQVKVPRLHLLPQLGGVSRGCSHLCHLLRGSD